MPSCGLDFGVHLNPDHRTLVPYTVRVLTMAGKTPLPTRTKVKKSCPQVRIVLQVQYLSKNEIPSSRLQGFLTGKGLPLSLPLCPRSGSVAGVLPANRAAFTFCENNLPGRLLHYKCAVTYATTDHRFLLDMPVALFSMTRIVLAAALDLHKLAHTKYQYPRPLRKPSSLVSRSPTFA